MTKRLSNPHNLPYREWMVYDDDLNIVATCNTERAAKAKRFALYRGSTTGSFGFDFLPRHVYDKATTVNPNWLQTASRCTIMRTT